MARPEFWDVYSKEDIDLPRVPPIALEEQDAHSARLHGHYSVGEAEITEDIIRRTRHGYYASIEYVDDKLAQITRVLEETGLSENTILVFASDHGDMMGERGMYYKKCFFEWAMRIPLIFWAPGRLRPARVPGAVSLLDILPTLADLAEVSGQVLETDGRTLVPSLGGQPVPDRTIAAEYLSEGVFDPTFMLLKDGLKLLYAEADPPILFDLTTDPDELENLADAPEHAAAMADLVDEARALWDVPALKARIIKDQDRRRLIHKSHQVGKAPSWDFQPRTDASNQYVRAGKWTVEVEANAHLGI